MKKHLLTFLFGAAVLCAAGSASGQISRWWWTDMYLANVTSFDIQITKVEWKGLDTNYPYVQAGDIIAAEKDPSNPSDPTHIGRVEKFSAGVKIEIWFKLLGHEGSEDCYLYINNPYSGTNSVTPGKTFPYSQCPSLPMPAASGESVPTPLYHNIMLPEHGHHLVAVALLAFQDFFKEGDFGGMDQNEVERQVHRQMDAVPGDKRAYQQKFGIYLP